MMLQSQEFDPDYDGPANGEVIMKGLAGYTHRFEDKRDLEHTIARYDGEIRYTDDEFGRFLAIAGEEKLLGNSLLTIITSDHGEEFNEHGGLQHGRTLYEEVIRIPLIIRWPEHIPAGATIYDPVQIVDIKPTLLSLLDLEVPQQASGSDLSKVIKTGSEAPVRRMALHVRSVGEAAALRCSRYKAILDIRTGETEVFDLAEDPAETTPLSKQKVKANQEVTSLLKQLMEWNKSAENALRRKLEVTGGQESTLTEQQTEALRSLGYIQ